MRTDTTAIPNLFQPDITRLTSGRTKRASSWDRTGGNADWVSIAPGENRVLAEIKGPGLITHFYFTMINPDILDFRESVLRMFWDGEETPSVEAPLGDFFCVGNCMPRRFASLMMAVNLGAGPRRNSGFNCYFPMPFAESARIELENESCRSLGGPHGAFWYHIEYEEHDLPPQDDVGRFHAQWRRENLTKSSASDKTNVSLWDGVNLDGAHNYVILEAEGQGHLAGILLNIDNVAGGWYGEGDDMIFIDGDAWPPSLHGTGSEEIFGGGACPDAEYAGPYTGFHLVENRNGKKFLGKNSMYRWYLHDPIRFQESIRMTIEHGHANNFENDYSSVAYWYQREPHAEFPVLPPAAERIPLFPEEFRKAHRANETLTIALCQMRCDPAIRGLVPDDRFERIRELVRHANELFEEQNYLAADGYLAEATNILGRYVPLAH
jgi:hypothetical protein